MGTGAGAGNTDWRWRGEPRQPEPAATWREEYTLRELLGLSAANSVRVSLSLARFAEHGTEGGAYPDGWGVAYYEQRDVRLPKGAEPAAASDLFRFIETHAFRNERVTAHTCHALHGPVDFENT